jgi:hypothetical protein
MSITPPGEPGKRPKPPITIPHVVATREPSSELDQYITRDLLLQCQNGEYYKCPRCNFQTQDAELMINHLQEEINAAITRLAQISEERRPGLPRLQTQMPGKTPPQLGEDK